MLHGLITLATLSLFLLIRLIANFDVVFIMSVCIISFYIGREQAQAERRYANIYCNGDLNIIPWDAVFYKTVWNTKSILDILFPMLAGIVLNGVNIFFIR